MNNNKTKINTELSLVDILLKIKHNIKKVDLLVNNFNGSYQKKLNLIKHNINSINNAHINLHLVLVEDSFKINISLKINNQTVLFEKEVLKRELEKVKQISQYDLKEIVIADSDLGFGSGRFEDAKKLFSGKNQLM